MGVMYDSCQPPPRGEPAQRSAGGKQAFCGAGRMGQADGAGRIPEVRILRQKFTELCPEQGLAERWSNALTKQIYEISGSC